MFRLHKQKSDRSGERFDFRFSGFQTLRVPKGWDKLLLHLVSAETGKIIIKSGKASVRNGSCRWTETLSESIWIPLDDGHSKDLKECLFKFVVALGSSRPTILGEASINLAAYTGTKASVPLSLPLEKCNHGTTLQLKIQCLTPRAKLRDEQCTNGEYDDMETQLNVSESAFSRSVASNSSNHLDSSSQPGELGSMDPSLSASGSHRSFNSIDSSTGNDIFSPQNNLVGTASNLIGRQDSTGSQNSTQSCNLHDIDDANRSNRSSFNSKASPLGNADSSKDLLEAAEVTIEELRIEARMWERNARKSVLDVEVLRKELQEQSKNQATLDMELSASQRECKNLKQEIEQLKFLLEESTVKHKAAADMKLQAMDMDKLQKELEDEIRFLRDSNADLEQQQQKTQQSNIELLSILQELEGIIEAQKMEIENLSTHELKSEEKSSNGNEDSEEVKSEGVAAKIGNVSCDLELDDNSQIQIQNLLETQKNLESTIEILEKSLRDKAHELDMEQDLRIQTSLDCESKWRLKLAAKEEEIFNLQQKLSVALNELGRVPSNVEIEDNAHLIKEVEFLKAKVEELEKDCTELTEENLQLLLKLKENKKDLLPSDPWLDSSCSGPVNNSACTSEDEVSQLKSRLLQLQQELKKKEVLIEERLSSDHLQVQCIDLENKCRHLEMQLQTFQDKALHLEGDLVKCHVQVEEQLIEIRALRQQLELCEGTKTTNRVMQDPAQSTNSASHSSNESFHGYSELCEQLSDFLTIVQKHPHFLNFPVDPEFICCCDHSELKCKGPVTQEEQVEVILRCLSQLYKIFTAHSEEHDKKICSTEGCREGGEDTSGCNDMLVSHGCIPNQVGKSSEPADEGKLTYIDKELSAKVSEIEALKYDHLPKEKEIEVFIRQKHNELENQISNLLKENMLLEESMGILKREKSETSTYLDELKNEMLLLNNSVESQTEANKILLRKSSMLEKSKQDLEVQLSELEEENMQLSERISAMEAQLRYLTNEKESRRLELQHSEHQAVNLHEDIKRLESEMEAQKIDMKQKLLEMQKRWLEAQEECEYLNKSNQTLQGTVENLIEESASLQKSNADLKRQNTELHTHCMAMEAQLDDSHGRFSKFSEKIEALDVEFSSMLEQIDLKEKIVNSELDSLIHENRQHKEKLMAQESLLNQLYAEKALEVENLQREIVHLIDQISTADDEKENVSSEAIFEVSALRAVKAKLEVSLQELHEKLAFSENKYSAIRMQYEAKVQDLMGELSAARKNQELLMADHEKLLALLESAKNSDERRKSIMNELEMNHKTSEFERLQLAEEISSLKVQLQKAALLQDETLALKGSLNEAKFENERMKASLNLLTGDHEDLKAEKNYLVQKISSMDNALLELEECRHGKIALEEKILRLQGDLSAREALCAQDAELKIELGRVKRTNSEFQLKIKHLEEDRQEYLKRIQALDDELKQRNGASNNVSQHASLTSDVQSESAVSVSVSHDDEKLTGNYGKQCMNASGSEAERADYLSKIQSLENELAEALEANDMYKTQLRRFLSEERTSDSGTPHISSNENAADEKRHESNMSVLEIELRDLRERYFQMSLKYAEVEAQREELVIKMKSMSNKRRWFS
ncbi:hypothetical protein Nepgr_015129 [Nepenthes gracilis]|uniref:C2 NT-type domain-containing protein n=1 Tax=Nepenthes gracilis TaxID=150966 RepID=A0AAD3XQG5_NEPGR|nr:hypothetical protein Nepgr_015129 [Nepenthes gracilis]